VDDSFERFAQAELEGLLRYAVMLTGERELARDLVQDVLLKAYTDWDRVGRVERPRAYVRTMITRAFLSWRRRWSSRTIVLSDVEQPDGIASDHARAHAERDDLWQRLTRLPDRQRAAIVLRYYEQLSDTEIAGVLHCTVGTVRSHVSRGLATLRSTGAPADEAPYGAERVRS
jgi:RNA polymerase sigma-70 factor (sigma-E family)